MSEEEKEAIENVKRMFGNIKIEELIKDKDFNITIYSLGILDILRVIAIVDNLQKELEEKTTILLAGAEKVKELEKGNRSLMESRIKWKNRYYKEKAKNKERDKYDLTTLPFEELKEMIEQNKNISIFGKEYINKDKIREKIEKLKEIADEDNPDIFTKIDAYEELLEEG